MPTIKTKLTACIKELGKEITESEYLKYLFKNQHKFEGWFQVELAAKLFDNVKDSEIKNVTIEKHLGNNRHADIYVETKNHKRVAVEIKFFVMAKSITQSRHSFITQLKNNLYPGKDLPSVDSYGVAIMVSENGEKWFDPEHERIQENFSKIEIKSSAELKYIGCAYQKGLISLRLFKAVHR